LQLIWPWQDRQRRFSALKASAFVLMFVPAIRLVDEFVTGQLGIYPMALGGFLVWRVGHGGSGLGRPKAQICAPS
jgi:hypothetical protein